MLASDGGASEFRYVNSHLSNTPTGLQTVTAFGLLMDVKAGNLVLFTKMTALTVLHTAVMSAVATKYFAPKLAKTLAMVGT